MNRPTHHPNKRIAHIIAEELNKLVVLKHAKGFRTLAAKMITKWIVKGTAAGYKIETKKDRYHVSIAKG